MIVSLVSGILKTWKKGLKDMYRVFEAWWQNSSFLGVFQTKKIPDEASLFLLFRYILPQIGKIISKDQSAIRICPRSVKAFPAWKDFS